MVHRQRSVWGRLAWLIGVGALLAFVGLGSFRAAPPPDLRIAPDRPGIGTRSSVRVTARTRGRGLSLLRVELVQGQTSTILTEKTHQPRPPWALWEEGVKEEDLRLEVGSERVQGLQPGEATLRVTAERAGAWLWRPRPEVAEVTLPVRLSAPRISVLSSANVVTQGGSGLVVYQVDSSAVRDGVRVGSLWFPGFPFPESGPADRFCLYGVPHDLDDRDQVALVAVDDLENEAVVPFLNRFEKRPPREEILAISEAFLSKVVPELLAHAKLEDRGSPLETLLAINSDLRERDAERLRALATTSSPRFLWSQPFLVALPKAKRTSPFGSRRSYLFERRQVDRQDHLGIDLASTRRASVVAANKGVVALAEYLGIYGNTVVLDHGCGLMTLYAHMSEIDVELGRSVERGQRLGRTGATGLAGGDHLHFGVLVRGLPVNPLEWWDARWVRGHVAQRLGGILDLGQRAAQS